MNRKYFTVSLILMGISGVLEVCMLACLKTDVPVHCDLLGRADVYGLISQTAGIPIMIGILAALAKWADQRWPKKEEIFPAWQHLFQSLFLSLSGR